MSEESKVVPMTEGQMKRRDVMADCINDICTYLSFAALSKAFGSATKSKTKMESKENMIVYSAFSAVSIADAAVKTLHSRFDHGQRKFHEDDQRIFIEQFICRSVVNKAFRSEQELAEFDKAGKYKSLPALLKDRIAKEGAVAWLFEVYYNDSGDCFGWVNLMPEQTPRKTIVV
jgi:hypothetical protein